MPLSSLSQSSTKLLLSALVTGFILHILFGSPTETQALWLSSLTKLGVGLIIFRALYTFSYRALSKNWKRMLCFGPILYALEGSLIALAGVLFWDLPIVLALLLASLSAALSPALVYPKLIEKQDDLGKDTHLLKLAAIFDNSLTFLMVPFLLSLNRINPVPNASLFLDVCLSIILGFLISRLFLRMLNSQKQDRLAYVIFLLSIIFGTFLLLDQLTNLSFFFIVVSFSLSLATYLEKEAYSSIKTHLDQLWQIWPFILAAVFIVIGFQIQLSTLFLIDRFWFFILVSCIGLRFGSLYLLAKKPLQKTPRQALEIASMMIPKLTIQLAFIPILISAQVPFARLLSGSLLASILISCLFHFGSAYFINK